MRINLPPNPPIILYCIVGGMLTSVVASAISRNHRFQHRLQDKLQLEQELKQIKPFYSSMKSNRLNYSNGDERY